MINSTGLKGANDGNRSLSFNKGIYENLNITFLLAIRIKEEKVPIINSVKIDLVLSQFSANNFVTKSSNTFVSEINVIAGTTSLTKVNETIKASDSNISFVAKFKNIVYSNGVSLLGDFLDIYITEAVFKFYNATATKN